MHLLPRNLPLFAILLTIFFATAIACNSAEPTTTPEPPILTHPPVPDNVTWILKSIDGNPIIQATHVTLKIQLDQITGYDGCNSYGGYSDDEALIADTRDGTISFPPVFRTARDCLAPPGVTDQANAYINALMQGSTYRIADDQLEILDNNGVSTLLFTRQIPFQGNPIDLSNTAWRRLTDGDATPATLAFLDERLLTGDTACRPYLATYTTSEETIRFPSTHMLKRPEPCSDEARTLEGGFGDFLTWAREYAVLENGASTRLTIRSAEGETLNFEPILPTIQNISDVNWTLSAIIKLQQIELGMWNTQVTHTIEDTQITLFFTEDTISGISGCNAYSATANIDDTSILIDTQTLLAQQQPCDHMDGLMDQERHYLELLPNITRYTIHGNILSMQTDTDTFLIFHSN